MTYVRVIHLTSHMVRSTNDSNPGLLQMMLEEKTNEAWDDVLLLASWMEESLPTGRLQAAEADRYSQELAKFIERREEKARIAKEQEEKKLFGLVASEKLKEAVKEAGELQNQEETTKAVGIETQEDETSTRSCLYEDLKLSDDEDFEEAETKESFAKEVVARLAKEEEAKASLAKEEEDKKGDEFVFELADGEEVAETLGLEGRVVAEQGEAPPKPSRNQRRKERKRQAERQERKEVEEGKTTEEELAEGRAKRRAKEEERVAGKLERSGLTARWEARLEELENRMKRQREEDAKAWGREVAKLGATIDQQQKDLEALKQEVARCYHRMPGYGRGARAGASAGCRPTDPRRAVPRATPRQKPAQ